MNEVRFYMRYERSAILGAMPPEVFIGAVVVAKLALDLGALALGPDFA